MHIQRRGLLVYFHKSVGIWQIGFSGTPTRTRTIRRLLGMGYGYAA
jgi:hypothetical protein